MFSLFVGATRRVALAIAGYARLVRLATGLAVTALAVGYAHAVSNGAMDPRVYRCLAVTILSGWTAASAVWDLVAHGAGCAPACRPITAGQIKRSGAILLTGLCYGAGLNLALAVDILPGTVKITSISYVAATAAAFIGFWKLGSARGRAALIGALVGFVFLHAQIVVHAPHFSIGIPALAGTLAALAACRSPCHDS